MAQSVKVGELRRLVEASADKFEPVVGKNVIKDDTANNEKAYKETEERVKKFNGGIKAPEKPKYTKENDFNKTTLDYKTESPISKEKKETIKAQAEGHASTIEKNNKEEKAAEFSDEIYNGFKEKGEEMADDKAEMKHAGLKARMFPKDKFEHDGLYEGKVPTLFFKKTSFLSEEHMKSRIPDEYKMEGRRFNMKDRNENKYLVEWKDNQAVILEHSNPNGLNESLDRMKALMGYSTSAALKGNKNDTVQEGFEATLNNVRKLIK